MIMPRIIPQYTKPDKNGKIKMTKFHYKNTNKKTALCLSDANTIIGFNEDKIKDLMMKWIVPYKKFMKVEISTEALYHHLFNFDVSMIKKIVYKISQNSQNRKQKRMIGKRTNQFDSIIDHYFDSSTQTKKMQADENWTPQFGQKLIDREIKSEKVEEDSLKKNVKLENITPIIDLSEDEQNEFLENRDEFENNLQEFRMNITEQENIFNIKMEQQEDQKAKIGEQAGAPENEKLDNIGVVCIDNYFKINGDGSNGVENQIQGFISQQVNQMMKIKDRQEQGIYMPKINLKISNYFSIGN